MLIHLHIDPARQCWACCGDLGLLLGEQCPEALQDQPLHEFIDRVAPGDRARFASLTTLTPDASGSKDHFRSLTLSLAAGNSPEFLPCVLEGYVVPSGESGQGEFFGTLRQVNPEADLDNILNFSGDMLALLDRDLRFRKLNNAYAAMFRKTPLDLVGKTVQEAFVHDPTHYTGVVGPILRKCLNGESTTFKEWVDVPEFGKMHLTIQYSPACNSDGEVESIAIVCQNTTEIMRSIEALRESEDLLRRNEEIARLGGWYYDVKTGAMHWTEQMYEIHGVDKSFMPSNDTLEEQFSAEDWALLRSNLDKNLAGEATDIIVEITIPGGERKWVRTLAFPIAGANGEVTQIRGVLQDVTKMVSNEKELETQKIMFETLAETTNDVITRMDRDGRHLYVNSAIYTYTGKTKEEFLGRTHAEIGLKPEAVEFWQGLIRKTLDAGQHCSSELQIRDINGRQVIFDCRMFPERNKDGYIENLVTVSRDITERLKHEDELQKLEKLKSLGLMAGGIAHDFNNTLTMLFGNVSLALSELEAGHPALPYLTKVEEAFERTTRLTSQLLTFAKGGSPIRKRIKLKQIIEETAKFDLLGSNVKLELHLPEDLLDAYADHGQLEQVFTNLILNAVQSMPGGGTLTVTASNLHIEPGMHAFLSEGSYVLIAFEDEGTGMSEEVQGRVFDPYFSTKESGSGLGLATVYSIISRHQGHIEVKSEPGTGSTFTIYLPANQVPSSDTAAIDATASKSAAKGSCGEQRILFMDDEEMVCDLAVTILQREGYKVEVAYEGSQAIELYKRSLGEGRDYDCIIMDLTIPGGMGGLETVTEILKLNPNANVIVSSGYSEDPVMSNYGEFGFKGVLPKPFTPVLMQSVVQSIIASGRH